ncbi:MAG TPA: VOC family protein [Geminicoccus sp.]|uniref:VOC family protein n=1 Tax=Geminicoccus sp. TaxID=2024832 RepID=UPI002BEE3F91|nr:VOC family protein [Geminicoccus sp.]HWL71240.1 VOC family protein [Geminicoccus sp.]
MSDAARAASSHAAGGATLAIERVVLTVHNLAAMRDFYRQTVGLEPMGEEPGKALLGTGSRVLLELREDRAARRRSAREAGLFHTAFLLPGRGDLGRWLRHAAASGLRLSGASDHRVSEAVYLDDPEGNGIEIYVDRPAASWRWQDGLVAMATERMDLDGVIASGGGEEWRGAPDGTVVGHVHLQVGALPQAEEFYTGRLGLDVTCRYPGAVFFSADGYHHHFAANVWNSRGAEPRALPSTGLTEVQVALGPARLAAAARLTAQDGAGGSGRIVLSDPWGTPLVLGPLEPGRQDRAIG